jgi:hypothetical protein
MRKLSKVCFENLFQNPKLLDMMSRSDLIMTVPFLNYPRWRDRQST